MAPRKIIDRCTTAFPVLQSAAPEQTYQAARRHFLRGGKSRFDPAPCQDGSTLRFYCQQIGARNYFSLFDQWFSNEGGSSYRGNLYVEDAQTGVLEGIFPLQKLADECFSTGHIVLAAELLHNRAVSSLAVLGCDVDMIRCVTSMDWFFDLDDIVFYLPDPEKQKTCRNRLLDRVDSPIRFAPTVRNAVEHADVILLGPCSRQIGLPDEWIREGTTILCWDDSPKTIHLPLSRADRVVVGAVEDYTEGREGVLLSEVINRQKTGRMLDTDVVMYIHKGSVSLCAALAEILCTGSNPVRKN